MSDLPYFDLILDERKKGGEAARLFKHWVHWGYWEDPKKADGSRVDFEAAMERLNALLLEAAKVADGLKLLDAGCGFGGTIHAIDASHKGMDLTGLNIDARQLAAAKADVRPSPGNRIAWVEADACRLPFEDKSFDRVLAVECVFHFPSRGRFLSEVGRVLKPGGYFALSDFVPTFGWGWGKGRIGRWIEARVGRAYGTVGEAPDGTYEVMARRAGLELVSDRDITKETLPTYPFLIKFLRREGSDEAKGLMSGPTRWLYWLSRLGLLRYRLLAFRRPT